MTSLLVMSLKVLRGEQFSPALLATDVLISGVLEVSVIWDVISVIIATAFVRFTPSQVVIIF